MLLRFCLPLTLCLGFEAYGQLSDTTWVPFTPQHVHHDELTLLVGYQQGMYGWAELGIGRNQYGIMHHPYDLGYYLGAELRVDRPELVGVKVAAYVDGGVAAGVQLIQYFGKGEGSTVFRPEIGIGLFKARITYGYNVALGAPRMPGINSHLVNISYALRLNRLPKDRDHPGRP